MGPDVVERLTAGLIGFDPEAPWASAAPMLLPVLRRVWQPTPPDATPLHIQVPPGITTGFGIDFGPAFSHVTVELVERWGVDHATLLGVALENLRRRIVEEPPVVQRFRSDGVGITAIQGQGWGSSLLLLPDVLRTIIGDDPQVLLAPVRNTIVALPEATEPHVAVDIWDAIAAGAHDELDVDPMRWTGRTVVAITDLGARGWPN